MIAVVKTIIVELNGYRPASVDVSQGDRGSRAVSCRLLENGAPWMIPEGATARVAYTLPNGTEGLYDRDADGQPMWRIAGNTVTVELADQLMAHRGLVQMSVLIMGPEGEQLATWPIRVNVASNRAARMTVPEGMPAYGATFKGKLFYGGPGGVAIPLELGPGLVVRDGGLYVVGASPEEPEKPVEGVDVTRGEDGTILLSCAAELDDSGTITLPVPVTLTEDGTIMIGGINNG